MGGWLGVWGCSVRRPSRPFTRWDRVPTRAAWACRRPAADDFPWTCAAGGARRPGGRLERRGARNPRHSVAVPVGGGGGVARLRALSEPASSSGSLKFAADPPVAGLGPGLGRTPSRLRSPWLPSRNPRDGPAPPRAVMVPSRTVPAGLRLAGPAPTVHIPCLTQSHGLVKARPYHPLAVQV